MKGDGLEMWLGWRTQGISAEFKRYIFFYPAFTTL